MNSALDWFGRACRYRLVVAMETQDSLHQMNRRATLQAVCCVRVTQPVRADTSLKPGAFGSLLDDAQNSRSIQRLAGPGAEHRSIWIRHGIQTQQILPHGCTQQNGPSQSSAEFIVAR